MVKKHIAEPIKSKKDIKAVEQYLKEHNERDYVLWVLGVNSGLRVSDIVGLNVSDVIDKTHITIIEKKTQKRKSFYINNKLKRVLKHFTKDRCRNFAENFQSFKPKNYTNVYWRRTR